MASRITLRPLFESLFNTDDASRRVRGFGQRRLVVATLLCLFALPSLVCGDDHPLTADERTKLTAKLDQQIAELTTRIEEDGKKVDLFSRRGDANFFRGRFAESVADYEKMVELNAELDDSHWRRGIARFYAGKFEGAAQQFERYHSFDDVDRENGIWRFFSQFKAYGAEKARAGLLKYKKDDREPFPSVYKLFSGEMTGADVLKRIDDAGVKGDEREKRLFYADLYIGLNDALEGRDESAIKHLRRSTANKWGPAAGYGPNYMWHVGRVHFELLTQKAPKKDQ